jgi:hypothetical protein
MLVTGIARWIWTGEVDVAPVNRFSWFRRIFSLDQAPPSGELMIAADSTARVWVNGTVVLRRVSRFHEPQIRAERVDVSRWLRPGRNSIVVLHHNWGPIQTFQRTTNLHAGLQVSSTFVVSDENWRWRRGDEFAETPQFIGVEGTARVRFPIDWDPRSGPDFERLHLSDLDDSAWAAAEIVTSGPWPETVPAVETPLQRENSVHPLAVVAAGSVVLPQEDAPNKSAFSAATLTPDPAAKSAAQAGLTGRSVVISGSAGETRYITWDMQLPVHGYPVLEVECDAGVLIELGYGELAVSLWDGSSLVDEQGRVDVDRVVGRDYRDVLRPVSGRFRYEIPSERTARWIRMQVTFQQPGQLTLYDAAMVSSIYPTEPRGSFSCGDERVDRIVRLAMVHARVTMTDTYVDTPGREDGQWIEDARPRALLASRWFGDSALRRFMIRTLAEGQNERGNLHPFYPSSYPWSDAPWDWSLQWVGMLWDDYLWSGDLASVEEYFPQLQLFWLGALSHVCADGIWRSANVLGDLRTSAAPSDNESSGIVTPWLVDRLRQSANMAEAIDREDVAAQWAAQAEVIDGAFRRFHVVRPPDRPAYVADVVGADGEVRGVSQAAQIRPLLRGIFTVEEARALVDWAFPGPDCTPPTAMARWNNPTWSYRVLKALTQNGFGERAVAHLKERFAPYLPTDSRNPTPLALQGPLGGPLPEYWIDRTDAGLSPGEINPHQPLDVTGSHGWAAMPLLWMHDTLLGVTIDCPGGAHLLITPVSAGLPYVSGTTMTPRGAVSVHYEPSHLRLTVDLPEGCSADLIMPAEFTGVRVVETKKAAEVLNGHSILCGGARYEFVASGPDWD